MVYLVGSNMQKSKIFIKASNKKHNETRDNGERLKAASKKQ